MLQDVKWILYREERGVYILFLTILNIIIHHFLLSIKYCEWRELCAGFLHCLLLKSKSDFAKTIKVKISIIAILRRWNFSNIQVFLMVWKDGKPWLGGFPIYFSWPNWKKLCFHDGMPEWSRCTSESYSTNMILSEEWKIILLALAEWKKCSLHPSL